MTVTRRDAALRSSRQLKRRACKEGGWEGVEMKRGMCEEEGRRAQGSSEKLRM
jgi:hypothetical protein